MYVCDWARTIETELRRIEDVYLIQSNQQKEIPQRSLEDRMLAFQQEYEHLCQKQMAKEVPNILNNVECRCAGYVLLSSSSSEAET